MVFLGNSKEQFDFKIEPSEEDETCLIKLLLKYSPIELMSLAIKYRMRALLGKCTVEGCEKEIYYEELYCSQTINGKDQYVCLEHAFIKEVEK